MKLPRWLMIGLWTSIVLAVLAAAGWWWVTWPERTAQEFVSLWKQGKGEEAETMLTGDSVTTTHFARAMRRVIEDYNLELEPPSAVDVIRGRRRFTLPLFAEYEVERGRLRQRLLP